MVVWLSPQSVTCLLGEEAVETLYTGYGNPIKYLLGNLVTAVQDNNRCPDRGRKSLMKQRSVDPTTCLLGNLRISVQDNNCGSKEGRFNNVNAQKSCDFCTKYKCCGLRGQGIGSKNCRVEIMA
jgi:hypothetical protein